MRYCVFLFCSRYNNLAYLKNSKILDLMLHRALKTRKAIFGLMAIGANKSKSTFY